MIVPPPGAVHVISAAQNTTLPPADWKAPLPPIEWDGAALWSLEPHARLRQSRGNAPVRVRDGGALVRGDLRAGRRYLFDGPMGFTSECS